MRWRREQCLLPRVALSVAALCTLAGTVISATSVLYPFDVLNRNSFIKETLTLLWLYRPGNGFNLPCVLGLLAASCILLSIAGPARGVAATWIFAALSIPLALAAFWLDWLMVPITQFSARYNSALMSLPLAALLLFGRVHIPLTAAITQRPVGGIVVLLGLTVSLWHVAATEQWSAFLTRFSNVLQSRNGIIAWDTVVDAPASREAKLATKMVWGWTNPDLSLVAVPRTCVNSLIDNPPWRVGWQPYTLSNIATLPAIPGVIYTYLLPPDQQRTACPAEESGGARWRSSQAHAHFQNSAASLSLRHLATHSAEFATRFIYPGNSRNQHRPADGRGVGRLLGAPAG
jgi:hypothetical protein